MISPRERAIIAAFHSGFAECARPLLEAGENFDVDLATMSGINRAIEHLIGEARLASLLAEARMVYRAQREHSDPETSADAATTRAIKRLISVMTGESVIVQATENGQPK